MTLDLKLSAIFFSLAVAVIAIMLLMAGIRLVINRSFASSGHAFYVSTYKKEPMCPTCPFKTRCPYANGVFCKFTNQQIQTEVKCEPSLKTLSS